MSMTRNDFELLAVALKSTEAAIHTPECLEGFNMAVNAVAEVCKANNARFDKKRFMAACGAI